MTDVGDGRAYGRPVAAFDADLVEVEAGTPAGELLRRYWHPFARAEEATAVPRQVRLLGEDLILYRDLSGTPGLLYPRCCHRGTTLYFGRVEDDGIRCPYHGWLFAADGQCRSELHGQLDRIGSVTARAAKIDDRRWTMDHWLFIVHGPWSMVHPDNRVIGTDINVTVMQQESIGKR